MSFADIGPVDTADAKAHSFPVNKKPHKVGEPAAPCAAKKPAVPVPGKAPAIRYATPKQARAAADEVFKVHEKLFHKLAQ